MSDTTHEMGVAYGAAADTDARTAKRIGVVIDENGKIFDVEPAANAKNYPHEVLARL